ncbi:TPA: YgiW/YdeI family stress tolerance OB fold protein [Enterobacter kobei]|nr:YgiW/YdeI family stress tolerance OB fold protein [Enterobacter kobei]
MKKTLLTVLLTGLSLSAFAQEQGFIAPAGQTYSQGGFSGPKPGLSSVAQAKSFRDDSWVILEGNIIQQVGHELYEFRDATGSINVEIDDKYWMGQTVAPTTKVRIEGEIDKDWNSVEVDVKNLQVQK